MSSTSSPHLPTRQLQQGLAWLQSPVRREVRWLLKRSRHCFNEAELQYCCGRDNGVRADIIQLDGRWLCEDCLHHLAVLKPAHLPNFASCQPPRDVLHDEVQLVERCGAHLSLENGVAGAGEEVAEVHFHQMIGRLVHCSGWWQEAADI